MKFTTPHRHRLSFALIGNQAVVAPVVLLLHWCCPFTIRRLVVAVVIFTVNTVLFAWRFAHISKEVFKFKPTFADLNAAPAIILKGFVFRILTSANHILPNTMNASAGISVLKFQTFVQLFIQQTTAALYHSIVQAGGNSDLLISATALAKPHSVTTSIWGLPNVSKNSQYPKNLIGQIAEFIMIWKRLKFNGNILLSHSVFSYLENGLIRVAKSLRNFWRPVSILPQNPFNFYNLGVVK